MKVISVTFKDLHRFGHTFFENDNKTISIFCDVEMANMEELFIRACLKDLDEKYDIVDEQDFCWDDSYENVDIEFITNLPSSVYREHFGSIGKEEENN